jgi:phosphohistidine phosphatase
MDLFLIRHAQAADGPLYSDDADRPLTAEGRRAALTVGARLASLGVGFDAVVVSPLVRAVETAELVAVSVKYEGELDVRHELSPEGAVQAMLDRALAPHLARPRVALVGHLPSMGHLLGVLLDRPGLSMSKMSVVRLSWDGNLDGGAPAKLVWSITPRRLDPVASLDGV